MFGSFGLRPIDVNGSNPAIAPKPMWLFSWVSGSCGFCPVCIVGTACGAAGCDDVAAPDRETPFTMWMVCEDWILYTESSSSSWDTGRLACAYAHDGKCDASLLVHVLWVCTLVSLGNRRDRKKRRTGINEPLAIRRDVRLLGNG